MDTLIIQVDLKNRKKPYQLGIEVVPPDARSSSTSSQQRQQQAAKQQYNPLHEYQNLSLPNGNSPKHGKAQNSVTINNGHHTSSSLVSPPKKSLTSYTSTKQQQQHQGGLLITKIYEGSVVDEIGQFRVGDIIVEVNGVNFLGRNFHEAQKILKTFVDQPSHGPLFLTVLRRASSSSSLPSTTGSQTTVIEREHKTTTSSRNLSPSTTPKKSSLNSPSNSSPQSSNSARHFAGALNTRRIGTIYCIKLTKSGDGGFGIKIAERDNMFGTNRPIYITAITTTGSAFRDGRLKEGDMLLEVNGIDLSGKSQPDVTKMLKAVAVNETVEFVVSRQPDDKSTTHKEYLANTNQKSIESSCDRNESLIDLNMPDQEDLVFSDISNHQFEKKIDSILNLPNTDGPGIYVYDIPLNDTKSAGLGLYLKCPNLDGKDLGIWIEKVITGGAAWKDNRLLPDDQILAINGINLMGLSNSVAYETLTAAVSRGTGPEATSNTIRLNIHRRDPTVVAKLLHGTNNRIEHSDLPTNGLSRSHSISDKAINSTQDSFKTALDNTIMHSRSQSSNNTSGSNSNEQSNQNSQNDSAMSPQTQASNSIKLSSSGNEKLDQNTSDSTNDTSSAISQITDYTFLPVTNDTTPEKNSIPSDKNQNHFTIPKTLETADVTLDVDTASSIQSWDNETGEEQFQRDGFGRQSISEKRHTQLMANSDTFRRNQKLREERERQRQIDEQLEKMRIEDDRRSGLLNYESQTLMRSMFRNRKINESFRAAVDRSYVYGLNESIRSDRRLVHSNDVAVSTASTSTDDMTNTKVRVKNSTNTVSANLNNNSNNNNVDVNTPTTNNSNPVHKKSSSLLSKFLKFGSMKRSKKKIIEQRNGKSSGPDTQQLTRSHLAQAGSVTSNQHRQYQHHRASLNMHQYQPSHGYNIQNQVTQNIVVQPKQITPQPIVNSMNSNNMMNTNMNSHNPHYCHTPPQPRQPVQASSFPQHHPNLTSSLRYQPAPQTHMFQNSYTGMSNGCHPPVSNFNHLPTIQTPNGLWVANVPPIPRPQMNQMNHINPMNNQQNILYYTIL